jgi:hypothetical protein
MHLSGTTRRGVLLGGAAVLAGGLVALAGRGGRTPLAAQAFAKMSAAWTFNRVDDVPLTYSNERPVPAAKRGRPRKDAEDDAS